MRRLWRLSSPKYVHIVHTVYMYSACQTCANVVSHSTYYFSYMYMYGTFIGMCTWLYIYAWFRTIPRYIISADMAVFTVQVYMYTELMSRNYWHTHANPLSIIFCIKAMTSCMYSLTRVSTSADSTCHKIVSSRAKLLYFCRWYTNIYLNTKQQKVVLLH